MTMENGKFGVFGGQYVPETLMTAVHEVEAAYEKYKADPQFQAELAAQIGRASCRERV